MVNIYFHRQNKIRPDCAPPRGAGRRLGPGVLGTHFVAGLLGLMASGPRQVATRCLVLGAEDDALPSGSPALWDSLRRMHMVMSTLKKEQERNSSLNNQINTLMAKMA